ncbi:MAG: hypothetical protein JO250_03090 [Armatimonadetes bacterium]|nr:hypothetical protein [Armatimonadota bacterium]
MRRSLSVFLLVLALAAFTAINAPANTLLWRVGRQDNSNAEFTGKANPSRFAVPADWRTRTAWPEFQGGSNDNDKSGWTCDIVYRLPSVPGDGALFTLKTIQASASVPELAVFSNGAPCGILQMVGSGPPGVGGHTFGRPYQIYIPKEFLRRGANTLRLQKLGHPYNRASSLSLWWQWDYFQLESLSRPATEPLHSKMTWMGVQNGGFDLRDTQVRNDPLALTWLGVAYSGNSTRTGFWSDITQLQPERRAYLDALRRINMGAIADGLSPSRALPHGSQDLMPDGGLPQSAKDYLNGFFRDYGGLFQYYELSNEPCMSISGDSMAVDLAVAKYVDSIKPATVKLAAPGWAYGGGAGDPKNWDADPANRRRIEQFCQAINGHAYADSYERDHGSLIENLKVYGDITDGWPKDTINTECGTYDGHTDAKDLGITQMHASMFDRDMRAHIGFCDRFVAFALMGNDPPFNFLTGDYARPDTWAGRPFPDAPADDNRVKIFRRYALAYATHGRPLPYVYRNPAQAANRIVLFRPVDTSALPPMIGSGATSRKILLNFVNFDNAASHTLAVRVQMPRKGTYTGERIGPQNAYRDARSPVRLTAGRTLDLTETLGPGEAVQYILEPPRNSNTRKENHPQ